MCRLKKKKKEKHGSLTVETALVMPLFIFMIINIISLFEMIHIHAVLDSALNQAGKEISTFANMQEVYEIDLLTQAYVKERVVQIAGRDKLDDSVIVGGTSGIVLWRSEIEEENDVIDLIMTYRVKPWISFFDVGEMVLLNRCYIKAYTGFEHSDDLNGEKKYYITETGEVYHTSRTCTHLKLSISMIEDEELEWLRNIDGKAYTSCEICYTNEQENNKLYVTLQGNRYHSTVACTGLKRTIYVITESQINGRPMCMRCMKESGISVGTY